MSIGIWIVVAVVLLCIGNLMGAKPNIHEKRLGDLRLLARKHQLHPKLIPTPEWLKTQGVTVAMIAQYTRIDDAWRLPKCECVLVDGAWQCNDKSHILHGQKPALSMSPECVVGLSVKANSISLYWYDERYVRTFAIRYDGFDKKATEDLLDIAKYLGNVATVHRSN